MPKEQTTDTEMKKKITPIAAYNILLQHHKEENRLLSERTTIFLAANSILFLAFVMLFQATNSNAWFSCLQIILSGLGIFLTSVFYSLATGTLNQLRFLWQAQQQIEEKSPEFSYMKEGEIAPQIYRKKTLREGFLARHASRCCIPTTFWVLWGASLIVVINNMLCTSPTPPA